MTEPIVSEQRLRTPVLRRSFRKRYPVAVRGEGVYVWDTGGNRYLDFSGSAAALTEGRIPFRVRRNSRA